MFKNVEKMHEAFFEQVPQTILQVFSTLRLRRYPWIIGKEQYLMMLISPVLSALLFTNLIVGHLRVFGCPTTARELLMLRSREAEEEEGQELDRVRSPVTAAWDCGSIK
jgi:hypothetical protein